MNRARRQPTGKRPPVRLPFWSFMSANTSKAADGIAISAGAIQARILVIRERPVMIDEDLARLYGVETKALTRAVRRNAERFPADFMFQLTTEEFADLRHQFGASSGGMADAAIHRLPLPSRVSRCFRASCAASAPLP